MNAHALGVVLATIAAVLFGLTTPFIAWLGGGVGALTTACLLYVGAALGVSLARAAGIGRGMSGHALRRKDLATIVGMAVCGAAIAPVLLVLGLARTTTVAASLALNGEVLFTILLAVAFFREPWRGRVLAGIVAILLGGVLLTLDQARPWSSTCSPSDASARRARARSSASPRSSVPRWRSPPASGRRAG